MRKKEEYSKRWFAWYPVTAWCDEKHCKVSVWLEFVHRRKIGVSWNWIWQYALIEKETIGETK